MKTLKLENSPKSALVDDDDYSDVSRFKWMLMDSGFVVASAFSRKLGKFLNLRLHRYVKKALKAQHVKHKNGNKLDNRKNNLIFTEETK